MRLIVAPDRAYAPDGARGRHGGRLYGVRSGATGDAAIFATCAILPTGRRETGRQLHRAQSAARHPQPAAVQYQSLSAELVFYQNFLYLDVEAIEDFKIRRARNACGRARDAGRMEALRNSESVEYEAVHAFKLRFLKLAFVEFLREPGASARIPGLSLARRRSAGALRHLLRARRVSAPRDPNVWIWPDWPEPYRDPGIAGGRAFPAKTLALRSVLQVPAVADRSAAGARPSNTRGERLPIGLYHDLALATDRFGSDLWAHRPFFVAGCRVGSPPDDFAPKGQDWAFPPPNSDIIARPATGCSPNPSARTAAHGGALRIDHVMRFFRLYWIPDGADATRAPTCATVRRSDLASWRSKACATKWSWWAKTWARWSRRCARRWRASAF